MAASGAGLAASDLDSFSEVTFKSQVISGRFKKKIIIIQHFGVHAWTYLPFPLPSPVSGVSDPKLNLEEG